MRDTKRSRRWVPSAPRAETYNQLKARHMNDVAVSWLSSKMPRKLVGPIVIGAVWCEADRHRDKDNVRAGGMKIILDALAMANVIPNDGNQIVDYFAGDKYEYGTGRVGVVLRVLDLGTNVADEWFFPHRLPSWNELHKAEGRGVRRGG